MKRWNLVVFLTVGIVCMISHTASAQFISGISEITAYGGVTINGDTETTAGVALTMNLTPQMGVEAEAGVIFAKDEIITANINLVLNLGSGVSLIVPYLTVGAGVLNNEGTDIALNGGGGLKLFIEPNIALRFDVRAFMRSEGGDLYDMERFYGGIDFLF